MRCSRFSIFLGGFLTAAACMIFTPSTWATSYAYAPISITLLPYFDPVDEIKLQAAIATEEALASTDDERLKLLPSIETRTALEDYRRLYYELG